MLSGEPLQVKILRNGLKEILTMDWIDDADLPGGGTIIGYYRKS